MHLAYFIILTILSLKLQISEQCTNCAYLTWHEWQGCTTGSRCGGLIRKRVRAMCCPNKIGTIDQCLSFCNVTDPWQEFVNSDPRKCRCQSSSLEKCCNGRCKVICRVRYRKNIIYSGFRWIYMYQWRM
jgi:hypothetical protein